jgi:hypothetical protein
MHAVAREKYNTQGGDMRQEPPTEQDRQNHAVKASKRQARPRHSAKTASSIRRRTVRRRKRKTLSREVQHTGWRYATGTANRTRQTESRIPEIVPIFFAGEGQQASGSAATFGKDGLVNTAADGQKEEEEHTGWRYATGTANRTRQTESRIPEIVPIFLDPIASPPCRFSCTA